jgi:hypothetical protein
LPHAHGGQDFLCLLTCFVDVEFIDVAQGYAVLPVADRILNDEDLPSAEASAHAKAGQVVIEDDDFRFRGHRRNGADSVRGELHEPNAILAKRAQRLANPAHGQSLTVRDDPMHDESLHGP